MKGVLTGRGIIRKRVRYVDIFAKLGKLVMIILLIKQINDLLGQID